MLTLDGLRVEQDGFHLSADWSVAKGARVAIIGPSGAGKSTLLAAIAGFVPLRSGRVLVDGRDVTGLAPAKRNVSLLFQDHNLFAHLSVANNVGLGLSPTLLLDAAGWAQVEDALATVGLSGLGARKPATLSGGQQSRAALARVLLMSRPVVLMDEPFSALGPALRTEMLELVKLTLGKSGATLLLVTHDPQDARRLQGGTVLMDQGVAMSPVDTTELFANPPGALRDYLG